MQDRAARLPGVLVVLIGLLVACSAPAPAGGGSVGSVPPGDARPAPAAVAATAPAASGAATPTGRPLPPRPDHGVEKVVVGVLGTTADVPFYLAEEAGYLEHMRVEPQFERFDSGGRMVASLATNQIEIGGGSPCPTPT